MLTSVQELHFNPTPMMRCLLKSGKDVDQCTRASLQPNTYEEVSTASMSHTGENDSGNSTPTKWCSKQVNVETSSMVNGQRVLTTDILS